MISEDYCKDANIDKDCIDIFNESSISDNGSNWVFKQEVYEMLNDYEVEEKFLKVHPEKNKKLRDLLKRFNNEEYTFHKSDMIEFVKIVEEYYSFGVKADKMVQIHERMKDLEKDFK
jgi:hypothetical protein